MKSNATEVNVSDTLSLLNSETAPATILRELSISSQANQTYQLWTRNFIEKWVFHFSTFFTFFFTYNVIAVFYKPCENAKDEIHENLRNWKTSKKISTQNLHRLGSTEQTFECIIACFISPLQTLDLIKNSMHPFLNETFILQVFSIIRLCRRCADTYTIIKSTDWKRFHLKYKLQDTNSIINHSNKKMGWYSSNHMYKVSKNRGLKILQCKILSSRMTFQH